VVDIASPHAPAHATHVLKVLGEIDASGIPQLLVLNKADLLPETEADPAVLRQRLLGDAGGHTRAVTASALTGQGISRLLATIDEVLPFDPVTEAVFRFPLAEGGRIALLHELGRVLEKRFTAESCEIRAEVPASVLDSLAEFVVSPDSH
jgi:GTP-binding protein HflX